MDQDRPQDVSSEKQDDGQEKETYQDIICMKWGTRYPAIYVNRLWSMISRNTARKTRLTCFTDDPEGIDPAVRTEPLPATDLPERVAWLPWRKISLWQDPLADLKGDVLFFDLDVVITGNIDEFFDYHPGRFCVTYNWTQPGQDIGNTSCYRFPVGKHAYLYEMFESDPEAILAKYRIDQQFISGEINDMLFWPADWCVSFKHTLLPKWPLNFFIVPELPKATKMVAFTGKPDQDEAVLGKWPVEAAWKRIYKYCRPTPWIADHWR